MQNVVHVDTIIFFSLMIAFVSVVIYYKCNLYICISCGFMLMPMYLFIVIVHCICNSPVYGGNKEYLLTYEPHRKILPMRKQRRRSAVQYVRVTLVCIK